MGKYANIQEVLKNVDNLNNMYIKAREYDKLTDFGKAELRCSLCGLPHSKAKQLITHNHIYICEQCVALMDNLCSENVEGYSKIKEDLNKV